MSNTPAGLSLRGSLGFLLKDSALYGGAAAVSKAFALLTFPLLARHFTVVEYGVLDYFLVLSGLLSTFFIFGQDSAVARFFYEYEDTNDRKQLISQSLLFQLVGLLLLLPFLWAGAEWITSKFIDSQEGELFFKIVVLQLPFLLLINFSRNLLKWTFARAKFLTLSLGFTVGQVSLLLISVIVFDVGIAGVLLVNLITCTIFGTLGLFFISEWLVRPINFHRIAEMLPYAIPIGIICIAAAFLPAIERTLTYSFLGGENLGYYAAATKIAMLIGLLVGAFQTAWGPFSLSIFKQDNSGQTFNWIFKIYALGICIASLTITLLAQPLIHFFASDRYSEAIIVVFPLVMGLAIQSISWITEIGIGISKRSYLNLYSEITSLSVTLLGIWFITPMMGLLGVGVGVLLGQVAKALIASWLAQKAYTIPWEYGKVIILVVITMIGGFLAIWSGEHLGSIVRSYFLSAAIVIVIIVGWFILLSYKNRVDAKSSFYLMISRITKK
jgi:O-antigen/teichoic acid export membrane protein